MSVPLYHITGPTGVGKTEIARRLAKLADAPFVKVCVVIIVALLRSASKCSFEDKAP